MLNDSLEKTIRKEEKEKKKSKNIDVRSGYLFVSLGTRISMIYLFFIFVIGKYLAQYFKSNNFYLISIALATIINVYIIINMLKNNK